MTKTLSIAFLISGLLLTSPFAGAADDSRQMLAEADELITKGKAKPAAALLRKVIKSNPDNANAHMQLGAALAAMVEGYNYDEAIAEEQQALKLDHNSLGARRILGKIYTNLHKFQESQAILKEAAAIIPTSAGVQRELGTACMAAGNLDEAASAFKKAIELKPDNVEAHVKLAILLSKKGDFPAAIAEASTGVKLGGSNAETHLTLANIKLESGDSAGSIGSFKAALAAGPNPLTAASALSGLGWAKAAGKDPLKESLEEAVLDQRKAIDKYPDFLTAHLRLADLLGRLNRNKEAEAAYQAALERSRGEVAVCTSYAGFLINTGRREEAVKILKAVLEKSPNFKPASDALAALQQNKAK